MNWDEEYRRLNIEFNALENKMNRCAAINVELLEALKQTLAALVRTDCYHHEIQERADIVEEARAAIAKATGEQHD